jgi:MocE subfamily Rieske [2Fe-2S] domain protein
MNNALYEVASFMVLRESTPWRWSHTRHHSDTIIVGRDPEIAVPRPVKLAQVILAFFNIPSMRKYVKGVFLHISGKVTPDEATYIPESAYPGVFLRARLYLLIYAAVIGLAVATRSILPLMFIGLPSLYGAWLMVVYGLTQHAGLAEDVLDHRLNARTVYMNRLHRYLYWNMGYHVEHHMFPLVPYHALPKLHALVKADMPPPYNGLLEAYREIIPTLVRASRDPAYFVQRPLPTPAGGMAAPAAITATQPAIDGWVEIGPGSLLQRGDLLRFDHADQTYVIYRTEEGKLYATDGICTHGNARLADGLLMGNLIECPKHNGRFDVRDGSPQRLPACVAIMTYDVRERDGKLLLDVTSGHGTGAAEATVTHTFRVLGNANVATFIKELVLAPDGPALAYQPGDYLRFHIPAYPERTLGAVDVQPSYAAVWRAQGTFELRAANSVVARRSYSMAGNPATDADLRFNVRLATPPPGQATHAGVGSSYLFGLRPGDTITASGPFGAFHIQPTEREMVYLGGGSGMAPLRSHIAHLFETERTTRRVSYWYGARSLQELFYRDYFEALARRHANFTFRVALSEPLPDDDWQGPAGLIHEVLLHEYLSAHPAPAQIEYYLCGPLPMIRAATKMLADLGVDREQIISDEF